MAEVPLSRKELLRRSVAMGIGAAVGGSLFAPRHLTAASAAVTGPTAVTVANPLVTYPDRGWEQVYRDQFEDDESFVFTCAPNDTHNCLLRACSRT